MDEMRQESVVTCMDMTGDVGASGRTRRGTNPLPLFGWTSHCDEPYTIMCECYKEKQLVILVLLLP